MSKPSWRVRLFHILILFVRPMTLGVRIVVSDSSERVLLVRHTYVPGWHLPGGGVERGETAMDAVCKELAEEAGIRPLSPPQLLTVYANRRASKRDHVLLYRCNDWEEIHPFIPTREIAEAVFFPLDDLPQGTTVSTRERLEEVFGSKAFGQLW